MLEESAPQGYGQHTYLYGNGRIGYSSNEMLMRDHELYNIDVGISWVSRIIGPFSSIHFL